MKKWLDALSEALDQHSSNTTFFFRDDDAGWAEDELFALLECFEASKTPLDLAAIPAAFDQPSAARLYGYLCRHGAWLGLHQHGFSHTNHQVSGRKCEFGEARAALQQSRDIACGRQLLLDYFGDQVAPLFTPPWNRCTQETISALTKLGFLAISRDADVTRLACDALTELPINIDWFKKREGRRITRTELGSAIAAHIAKTSPIGIMLHHQHMDRAERDDLVALLEMLECHPRARCAGMRALLQVSGSSPDVSQSNAAAIPGRPDDPQFNRIDG